MNCDESTILLYGFVAAFGVIPALLEVYFYPEEALNPIFIIIMVLAVILFVTEFICVIIRLRTELGKRRRQVDIWMTTSLDLIEGTVNETEKAAIKTVLKRYGVVPVTTKDGVPMPSRSVVGRTLSATHAPKYDTWSFPKDG